MGQTLVKYYAHIVFSTRNRVPLILSSVENDLFSYIGGICRSLKCGPVIVGGYLEHIHILCNMSTSIAMAKLMEEVKGHSSKWMKTRGPLFQAFQWQQGYGVFSVTPTEIEYVRQYIADQKKHHAKRSFQEEYLDFLKTYDVPFDEKFLWS